MSANHGLKAQLPIAQGRVTPQNGGTTPWGSQTEAIAAL